MESSRSLAAAHTTEVWAQGFCQRYLFFIFFFAESLHYQRYINDAAETASVLTKPSLTYLSLPLCSSSVGSNTLNWGGNSNSSASVFLRGSILFPALRDFKVVEGPCRRYCLVLSLTSKHADEDPCCRRCCIIDLLAFITQSMPLP